MSNLVIVTVMFQIPPRPNATWHIWPNSIREVLQEKSRLPFPFFVYIKGVFLVKNYFQPGFSVFLKWKMEKGP